jgi:membrane-associated phospholipid phosphatase
MVYGYNLAGIKGKHNFKERTIIYGTSQLLSAAFVMPLKYLVKEERPDGSNSLSFPSGHTATAFSSAQFLSGSIRMRILACYFRLSDCHFYRGLQDVE